MEPLPTLRKIILPPLSLSPSHSLLSLIILIIVFIISLIFFMVLTPKFVDLNTLSISVEFLLYINGAIFVHILLMIAFISIMFLILTHVFSCYN